MTLPNRTTVAALALLMLASATPTAPAQVPSGSDVLVDHIELGEGVAGVSTNLRIFIKNQGDTNFDPSGGWQLWLGYKSSTETTLRRDDHCIDTSQPVEGASDVCYQRFTPTDPARVIPAGGVRVVEVAWTANRATQGGIGAIVTAIERLGCEQQTALNCYDDPPTLRNPRTPDANPGNNVQENRVFIKVPAVRAVPLRDAPDVPGANVNTAWRTEDVKEPCLRAPDVTRYGCKAKPDTLLVFEYLVINEGNSGDTFVPTLQDDSPTADSLLGRGFDVGFQPREVVIPSAQGTKVVRVEVLVPKGEKVGNATNLGSVASRIQWRSLLDGGQTTSNVPDQVCTSEMRQNGLCQSPSFPTLLIDAARSVNATTLDARKQANVSQLDEFNVTLNNTGNVHDTFSVKLDRETSAINDSWSPSFPSSVSLDAFTQTRFTMTVIPPANATKGPHPFDLVVQSTADTEGTTLRRLHFEPDLQQQFGLTGYTPTPLLRVVPAKAAPFVMYVINTGNGPDNVTLGLENVPFGWTAALSNRTVMVPAFGVSSVFLNVTAPENTPPDVQASFFVNATSQGPSDTPVEQRPRVTYQLNMSIQSGSNVRLSAPITSTFIDPGATHEFDVVIRNTGNARDAFTITAERDQSQLAWAASVTPTSVALDPLEQVTAHVTLRAPTTATVGETSRVFVTVVSNTTKSTFEQVKLEGRVSGPDLFVSAIVANATQPYAGDPLEINVVFGNGGNKAPAKNATLKVYFVPQNGAQRVVAERTYGPTELVGGRRVAELIVWENTSEVEGDGTLIARIDELNEIPEIDDTPASNEATRTITLRVFDIRLTPAEGLSGRPGEKVSYSDGKHVFLAEYRGNQPTEPVDIYITSEHGWGESRLALALPRGSVIPILADVSIPQMPGVARDTLRVTIVPSLRPESVVTATTTTTVTDDVKPAIRGVAAEPNFAKLGVPVTLRAEVVDATGLSSVRAFVATPANETQSFLLEPKANNVWALTQTWSAAGVYRFYVEATDGSDAKNVNTSRDVVATFTITPGSVPVIQLADGQSSTIRSGTQVKLNITDPLGVGKASYAIKGVSYDLPRPFAIDTSSFPAGTVDVAVTAENVYGVATTQKFTFVVDNTPPGIRSVTLDPAKPKANEDVTIRIETDTKVNAVDVVVKKDGQVLETRSAQRQGAGVFTLLLNPPEGDYAIDVTAKDAAGNTKLQEGAVTFSAKPASPFDVPGPGLGLVGLAIVAVALALRRRT